MLALNDDEARFILESFAKKSDSSAHSSVWKRRSYASMYIYTDELKSLREAVMCQFPDYCIAFDVIFDSDGSYVAWHCDYESLGPFYVPNRLRAITNHHFLSIHFNLTPDGGSLVTYDGIILSYIHYLCIAYCGIFGIMHTWLEWISRPFLSVFSSVKTNVPLVGNVFDNTRLHCVTMGDARTSYVLRLVKKNNVKLTHRSVQDGISRSKACHAFIPLLSLILDTQNDPLDVKDVNWEAVFKQEQD